MGHGVAVALGWRDSISFEYNDPKAITQRSWFIYNNELNESNKEVKIRKNKLKKNLRGLELRTFWSFGYIFSYNFIYGHDLVLNCMF